MRRTRIQISVLCIILLLFIPSIIQTGGAENVFIPVDDSPQDNAYNLTNHFALQWWYFDMAFPTNASMHIGIVTIGAHGKNGFYLIQLQYYTNGQLSKQARRLLPLRLVSASTDTLQLSYKGKTFLREYLTENQDVALDVNLTFHDLAIALTFIRTMKGWKGSTDLGMWGCPLPKATVHGAITINSSQIPVEGIGYQEHGWDIQSLHRSWFWGKLVSDHLNLVFSRNMKTITEEDVFVAVANWGAENYTSIERDNITLTPICFVWNHGRRIPTEFVFKVDQDPVHINVTISVVTVQFSTIILMNYWRCHMRVTGTMTVGNVTDDVDNYQIMEYFHNP